MIKRQVESPLEIHTQGCILNLEKKNYTNIIIIWGSCKTIARIRDEGIPAPKIPLKTQKWSWRALTPE